MVNSTVALCNLALTRLGSERIASITETSKPAILCNQYYQQSVDDVIRSYPWKCATARQQLAALDITDNYTPYTYAYQMPNDCLRMVSLLDEGFENATDEYIIEQRRIYTDLSPAYIKYLKRPESVLEIDSHVVDIIASKLAFNIAFSLTQSQNISAQMAQEYQMAYQKAMMADGLESKDIDPSDWWVE
jgi:hypothetical protein